MAASLTVYVTVDTPLLKTVAPRLLIPVAAELPVVTPVMAHVKVVTAQLSPVVGFEGVTEAVHAAPAARTMFDGQVIVGKILSVTVTVNEQVA